MKEYVFATYIPSMSSSASVLPSVLHWSYLSFLAQIRCCLQALWGLTLLNIWTVSDSELFFFSFLFHFWLIVNRWLLIDGKCLVSQISRTVPQTWISTWFQWVLHYDCIHLYQDNNNYRNDLADFSLKSTGQSVKNIVWLLVDSEFCNESPYPQCGGTGGKWRK